MQILKDLAIASALTLVCGTICLEGAFAGVPDVVAATGILLSIAAGPATLWRRGTQPLIPISAIYCMAMLVALVFIHFNLAWRRGLVDL